MVDAKANCESYLIDVGQRLVDVRFSLVEDDSQPMEFFVFARRQFKITRFGLVDTVCVFACVDSIDDIESVQAYSARAMKFAMDQSSWPLGLGRSLVAYPVLLTGRVALQVRQWIAGYTPSHVSAIEFPVLVDLDSGELSFYRGTPIWGFAYGRKNRQDAERFFRPSVGGPNSAP